MTAEHWVPIVEVSEAGLPNFLEHKKKDGFFLIGLEQTANSFSIDEFSFPKKVVSFSLSLSLSLSLPHPHGSGVSMTTS